MCMNLYFWLFSSILLNDRDVFSANLNDKIKSLLACIFNYVYHKMQNEQKKNFKCKFLIVFSQLKFK